MIHTLNDTDRLRVIRILSKIWCYCSKGIGWPLDTLNLIYAISHRSDDCILVRHNDPVPNNRKYRKLNKCGRLIEINDWVEYNKFMSFLREIKQSKTRKDLDNLIAPEFDYFDYADLELLKLIIL
jgi:hypothetical protein